jgi:hypothetical protein
MSTKRLWFPVFVREDAEDYDYLDKLSPADRAWHDRFRDEYHNAAGKGISSKQQLQAADRGKKRARRDLFSYGLRADGEQLTYLAAEPIAVGEEVQRPEVLAIMEELRALRPGFDDADGRKRAQFASPAAERRFYALRERLTVLLGGEE